MVVRYQPKIVFFQEPPQVDVARMTPFTRFVYKRKPISTVLRELADGRIGLDTGAQRDKALWGAAELGSCAWDRVKMFGNGSIPKQARDGDPSALVVATRVPVLVALHAVFSILAIPVLLGGAAAALGTASMYAMMDLAQTPSES